MAMDTVKLGYGDDAVDTGQLEILCNHCLSESRRNEPEDWYEGLYHDRHAHAVHYVMSSVIAELLEGGGYDWLGTAPDGYDPS